MFCGDVLLPSNNARRRHDFCLRIPYKPLLIRAGEHAHRRATLRGGRPFLPGKTTYYADADVRDEPTITYAGRTHLISVPLFAPCTLFAPPWHYWRTALFPTYNMLQQQRLNLLTLLRPRPCDRRLGAAGVGTHVVLMLLYCSRQTSPTVYGSARTINHSNVPCVVTSDGICIRMLPVARLRFLQCKATATMPNLYLLPHSYRALLGRILRCVGQRWRTLAAGTSSAVRHLPQVPGSPYSLSVHSLLALFAAFTIPADFRLHAHSPADVFSQHLLWHLLAAFDLRLPTG